MQKRSRGIDMQVVEDHDNLFVMAELIHFVGIGLLAWKLLKKKNAGGKP
jgi:ER lumen protein retaining receptor